jgi:NitT/TauT family transport system permease protein
MTTAPTLEATGNSATWQPAQPRPSWSGAVAATVWLAVAVLVAQWPNAANEEATGLLAACAAFIGLALLAATLAGAWLNLAPVARAAPWLVALALLLGLWEVVTAKLDLLSRPFFATPQSLLEVYVDDWRRLGESVLRSLMLLSTGYVIGVALGFVTGVTMGWSRIAGYWLHPVLRFIGPLPATAWLPVVFFAFPSSWSAGVFLIALATGFPVTVLTWSGIAGVNKAYYDVARTLGAGPAFLIFKIAVPAAMPSVFVGLFMGLGSSFAVLVVAEMMGVKAGLGWYLSWAQGWAAYPNMYAALVVMALICSGLITLLFRVRDRLLCWQKGQLRW